MASGVLGLIAGQGAERLRTGAEPEVEPVREQALHDEPAGEGVEGLKASQLENYTPRPAQTEGSERAHGRHHL